MFPTFKLSYQATFFIVSPDRLDDSSPAVLSKEMGKIAGLLSKFPTYCPKEILMVYMMQVSIFWKFYTFLTESVSRNIAKTYNKSLSVFIDHEFWVTQKISRISPGFEHFSFRSIGGKLIFCFQMLNYLLTTKALCLNFLKN